MTNISLKLIIRIRSASAIKPASEALFPFRFWLLSLPSISMPNAECFPVYLGYINCISADCLTSSRRLSLISWCFSKVHLTSLCMLFTAINFTYMKNVISKIRQQCKSNWRIFCRKWRVPSFGSTSLHQSSLNFSIGNSTSSSKFSWTTFTACSV